MILGIDVGNTNIKFALMEGDEIACIFRLTTKIPKTSDEYSNDIITHFTNLGYKKSQVDGVIVSSVVPNIMHALTNALIKVFGMKAMQVGPGMKTGIKIIRANPKEVGADRIVGGVSALDLYGGPVIVCDYGTATRFDLFTEDSEFIAAVTCPGMMISAQALWGGTAKLPEIEIEDPGSIIAQDTISSLQAGILYGHIGEAEYIIDRLKRESGLTNAKVVATGGMSSAIFPHTHMMDYLEPNLAMHGLKVLYDKNK